MKIRFWAKTNGCYHEKAYGIYGDEIIFGVPKFSRGYCPTCNTFFASLPQSEVGK